jgi:HAD superfamily hydrolase (TIGR01509 family)
MNFTHWIFDLDNTLADSAIDFNAMRQDLGLPLDKPILEEIDTRPTAEAAELHRHLAEIERGFALRATPLPGVHEILSALAKRGARLGILTRNSRANALETLAVCDLAEFFDPARVLGRDEAAPKPDPEGIHKLLAAWDAAPDTAVMVGDFRYDLEAGRRAGAATIYYDAQNQDLWTADADIRVQSHAELLTLIRGEQP